jgi:acetyl-CoA C-acetyltransferase
VTTTSSAVISGTGEAGSAETDPTQSLEGLIFASASAALADAGLQRDDLDGVVLSASDQVDGRAIASMLSAGPAGAYLNEEINVASSPGHGLALAYMQILSGTHRRLLVSSWGKASETKSGSTQAAERLSAEPFFERDGGLTALAADAMQAQLHRAQARDPRRAAAAAAAVAAKNHGGRVDADQVASSPLVAHPLRALECPPQIDGSYSIVLERDDRAGHDGVLLQGAGWCSEANRVVDRDLVGLPHLVRAARDAFGRARIAGVDDVAVWELHDYTPDAELLAYAALGLCSPDETAELALSGATARDGATPVNATGGSVAGEAPFGGPLRKVLRAVRQLRGDEGREHAVAQIASGFAGQFQSVFVLGRRV